MLVTVNCVKMDEWTDGWMDGWVGGWVEAIRFYFPAAAAATTGGAGAPLIAARATRSS